MQLVSWFITMECQRPDREGQVSSDVPSPQTSNWRYPRLPSLTVGLLTLVQQKNRLTSSRFFSIITFNTGKEVIQKYMSSNHSEVAET